MHLLAVCIALKLMEGPTVPSHSPFLQAAHLTCIDTDQGDGEESHGLEKIKELSVRKLRVERKVRQQTDWMGREEC